jgi:hypothetical protein
MANLSATLTAELNHLRKDLKWQRKQLEMSIIDPDYFKRHPQSEDEMDDEYSRFLHQVEANIRYNNFIDAFEKELELKSLPIKRGKEKVKGETAGKIFDINDSNSHYAEPIRPPKTGDLSFNEICSMEKEISSNSC